jgi:hypothetical protein
MNIKIRQPHLSDGVCGTDISALASLALDWLPESTFVENKGDDWVRLANFCFADAAFAVTASRDGNGSPHAGLIIAWGLGVQMTAD